MSIGSHQRTIGRSQVHITPRRILDPLGCFDLDPCGSDPRPWDCAATTFTERENGLTLDWFGRVFLNPPFDTRTIALWLDRMAQHDCGIALVHARTDTQWFKLVQNFSSALLFLEGRVIFHKPDGSQQTKGNGKIGDSGAPVVLAAFGGSDRDMLAACGLAGLYVPLIIPRSVLAMFVGTWADFIAANFPDGEFHIDDVYRLAASHPKAGRNRHLRAKLRQTLNERFERVAPGRYRSAA